MADTGQATCGDTGLLRRKTMKIWILRHGQAEGMAASDEARQLTLHGREEATLMADYLAEVPLDGILASPYRRAQQTAETV